jgi:CDP-6-deoxy-D-xylo-4-hexulose-3-dehydrase
MKSEVSVGSRGLAAQPPLGPWPLMRNNISRADLDSVIQFLQQDDPILTQSANVRAFEREWSAWLGVKHSVFVNSGSSANLLSMAALRHLHGPGEVIVPTLTWVSDIASVLQCGFSPVFADINPRTLGMDTDQVLSLITPQTRAVFLTHVLGYNALTNRLLVELRRRNIPLIEDVCESHGATHEGRKVGAFGWMSDFSFYYAHHLSTIEGGMICTDDSALYEILRMLRSHGMVRESSDDAVRRGYYHAHPDLNPDFIFAFPAYNVRSTEINAVVGRSQLPRLDSNNRQRTVNLETFLQHLDSQKYWTDFATEGSSNYALTLVLKEPNLALRDRIEAALRQNRVEFRRGTSGGGNQLRQPYLRKLFGDAYMNYPRTDHVHAFGWYIGNYPDLETSRVLELCELLNNL